MRAIDKSDVETADHPSGRGATLWRKIAETLESEIVQGLPPQGTALPTVLELASRFSVNRHTVRQALQSLQVRGLVSIEQGRGTFVRKPAFDYRLGRRVRFGDSFVGDGDTDNMLVGAMEVEPALDKEARRLKLAPGTLLWTFRTLRSVGGHPFSTSTHRLEQGRWPDFDKAYPRTGHSITRAIAEYGIHDFLRLSTRLSAVLPTEEERLLLKLGPDEPILLSKAIDGLINDQPFHTVTTAFIGARVELVLDT